MNHRSWCHKLFRYLCWLHSIDKVSVSMCMLPSDTSEYVDTQQQNCFATCKLLLCCRSGGHWSKVDKDTGRVHFRVCKCDKYHFGASGMPAICVNTPRLPAGKPGPVSMIARNIILNVVTVTNDTENRIQFFMGREVQQEVPSRYAKIKIVVPPPSSLYPPSSAYHIRSLPSVWRLLLLQSSPRSTPSVLVVRRRSQCHSRRRTKSSSTGQFRCSIC
jgi:hypothetical protein